MKTVIKCLVHYQPNQYAPAGSPPALFVFPFDMSEHGYVLLGTADFEYDLAEDFNPLQAEIGGLQKQLDILAEKYHTSAAAIRERISNLQCIEHAPARVAERDINF